MKLLKRAKRDVAPKQLVMLRGHVVYGVPRKAGDTLEVDATLATVLIGLGAAKVVEPDGDQPA